MTEHCNRMVIEEMTDPEAIARNRAQLAQFEKNGAWFEAHAPEIYERHRGKIVCVAGQELFVADTVEDVLAAATAAHPGDAGRFTRILPTERGLRIYAAQRLVAPLR